MTIGQLSQAVSLPAKTIRFYEQIKLIAPPMRSSNGYRTYPPDMIEDLKMIKYARDLGLPIPEIKKLMRGCNETPCQHDPDYLQNEIDSYIKVLSQKITQMNLLQSQLTKLKKLINDPLVCHPDSRQCCNILHQLTQLPKKEVM